jgi:hypothetical protein
VIQYYDFDSMTILDARQLDDKVVTIETWSVRENENGYRQHYPDVRVMYAGGHRILLLADGAPGPADELPIHLVKTVEIHS